MKITASAERFPLAQPFTISRGTRTHQDVVVVEITHQGNRVQGECTPYPHYGESVESVINQIEAVAGSMCSDKIAVNIATARETLQASLPAGAARNAIDSALWRLEHQEAFPSPQFDIKPSIITAMTVSLGDTASMAAQARELCLRGAKLLKVKLDDNAIVEKVSAIREVAAGVDIILDANEAWGELNLAGLFKALSPLNIKMIEQPVPKGQDHKLQGILHPIPLCADESCHTSKDLDALVGQYEMVNIKLDKTGGLTEALKLEAKARELGFDIMVGCMVGSSLAMETALPIASRAEIVDLDGPVLLKYDRDNGLKFDNGYLYTR
ncbi:L-Ala-D/L-Glu epimerase [Photobacterium sanctipauli]|uniref:Dipeptide epimerase n=1 Tax=Photobacterium sanctipauli TaxID=1342794 RepID=A0A2T3NAK4_9GAMM|nr:N-acetyl-D-Glu racemase DgcA [Photobacterium sanctipauli]PSW10761.1 L-Ala-D/L-Glu epimerase [Photobacterium sanctipauli]